MIVEAKAFIADTLAMTDPIRRAECTKIGRWLNDLLLSGTLRIGKYTDIDPVTLLPTHWGQFSDGIVHIDVRMFEQHRGDLLTLLMHEATHRAAVDPSNEIPEHGEVPDYTLPIWRSLEASDDSKSCHKPY